MKLETNTSIKVGLSFPRDRHYGSPDGEAGNRSGETEVGEPEWVTMAAGPGVAMQSGSPARELSISVQQGGNQTHGDRVKTEEVTGKNTCFFFNCVCLSC